MTAPAIVIRLELEAAPKLYVDAVNSAEHDRLLDWIGSQPHYLRLIQAAIDLEAERRAA